MSTRRLEALMLNRRAFLSGSAAIVLAIGIGTSPGASSAQQEAHRRVGYIGNTPESTTLDAFQRRLRELGYVEGRNLHIEWRWAEGRAERYSEIAVDLVRRKVDVIVALGSQATEAAKEASSTIPIVFVSVSHPVEAGFVASLSRPGGNITGVSNQLGDTSGKTVEILRETKPKLSHIGILWNPANQGSALGKRDLERAVKALHLKLTAAPVQNPEDLEPALTTIATERLDALVVHPTPVIYRHRQRVAEFARDQRLPTMTGTRIMVEDGSMMMSYGPDFVGLFRRMAEYVSRILKGANPADLPIEQPTKFELVINLKTARALGLTIPPSLLLPADQLIE